LKQIHKSSFLRKWADSISLSVHWYQLPSVATKPSSS
jgi:hypothetical protein